MNILDRYLGRMVLHYTLLCLCVLLGLSTFTHFVDQFGQLGTGGYTLGAAARYVALILPHKLYELAPMAALLGTAVGLSVLATEAELMAIRASGVTVLRIAWATLKASSVFILIVMLLGEWVAPRAQIMAEQGKAAALQQNLAQQTRTGLWLRDAHHYINIGQVLADGSIADLRVFTFDANHQLQELFAAERGYFQREHWVLQNFKQSRLTATGQVEVDTAMARDWQPNMTPATLAVLLAKPQRLSSAQLHRYITYLDDNRQNAAAYRLAFWHRLLYPFAAAVMVVLAVPYLFGTARAGRLGRNLFVATMLGIAFFVIHQSFGYVVLATGLPPFIGAVLPLLLFFIMALFMLRRAK